jgi:hypothetical protein
VHLTTQSLPVEVVRDHLSGRLFDRRLDTFARRSACGACGGATSSCLDRCLRRSRNGVMASRRDWISLLR